MAEVSIKLFASDPKDPDYQKVLRRAQSVARRFGEGRVEVVELPADGEEAAHYGVVLTPTIVVNDTIVSVGKLLPGGRLARFVQAELDSQQ